MSEVEAEIAAVVTQLLSGHICETKPDSEPTGQQLWCVFKQENGSYFSVLFHNFED